jgi:RsiW-degrading membrane proteinase PrsW (M82 family)
MTAIPTMRRTSRSTWVLAGLILANAMILGPLSLAVIGLGVGDGFFAGLLMAAVPVPFYLAFALWVDRFEPEPPWLLVLAFIWGGAIAVFFSLVFNMLHEGIVTAITDAASASVLTAVLAAPFIEELTKGAALFVLFLWKRDHFDNVTDGIVYASMVGLGFAMTENVQYYGQSIATGGGGAAAVFFLRGILSPFSHPLFTSMTGIGLGFARESNRKSVQWLAPAAGLTMAMALHSLWNFSANAGLAFFAVYALIMVPAFFAVLVIAIFSLRREANVIRTHLGSLVAEGVLSGDDIIVLASVRRRIGATTNALFARGFGQWRARRRFHTLATELAFHSWRTSREATADAQVIHAELRDAVRAARAKLGLPAKVQQPEPALVARLTRERPLPAGLGGHARI